MTFLPFLASCLLSQTFFLPVVLQHAAAGESYLFVDVDELKFLVRRFAARWCEPNINGSLANLLRRHRTASSQPDASRSDTFLRGDDNSSHELGARGGPIGDDDDEDERLQAKQQAKQQADERRLRAAAIKAGRWALQSAAHNQRRSEAIEAAAVLSVSTVSSPVSPMGSPSVSGQSRMSRLSVRRSSNGHMSWLQPLLGAPSAFQGPPQRTNRERYFLVDVDLIFDWL
jgi:hypothetical protein